MSLQFNIYKKKYNTNGCFHTKQVSVTLNKQLENLFNSSNYAKQMKLSPYAFNTLKKKTHSKYRNITCTKHSIIFDECQL